MKTFYLIRHAKSSWKEPGLRDIERPLNARGKRDAPFMAQLLKGKEERNIDAIYSSPAVRAFTTAQYFGDVFGLTPIRVDEIYEAGEQAILDVLRGLEDSLRTVMLFGHNPTFTILANRFGNSQIDNVPTCGIAKYESTIPEWRDLDFSNGNLTAFYYPKQF